MSTTSSKTRSQLEQERDILLRQVRLLDAKCRWLSSYNQELWDICLGHQQGTPLSTAGTVEFSEAHNPGIDPALSVDVSSCSIAPSFLPGYSDCYSQPPATDLPYSTFVEEHFTSEHESSFYVTPDLRRYIPYNTLETAQRETACETSGLSTSTLSGELDLFESLQDVNIPAFDYPINTFCPDAGSCNRQLCSESPAYLNEEAKDEQTVYHENGFPTTPPYPTGHGLQFEECDRAMTTVNESNTSSAHPRPLPPHTSMLPANCLYQQPQVAPDLTTGFNTSEPKGYLDRYIAVLGKVLNRIEASKTLPSQLRQKLATEGVLWAVREAWPQAEHYWKVTASFQGFMWSELWRNFPHRAVYESMHPAYRPTPTQLSTPHCALIDWLPWPDIRDRVIQHQHEVDVDMLCKLAIQNVVAHRLPPQPPRQYKHTRDNRLNNTSTKHTNGKHTDASSDPLHSISNSSFRIFELCLLEENAGSRPSETSTALVYRPRSAPVQALEKAYRLEYNNFQTQKLHAQFFDAFPFLFVESALSKYTVQGLPAIRGHCATDVLGSPREISLEAVQRLRDIVSHVLR
ncbi:hypothetical protein FG03950.1 [Paecilomyces variotii No. 5]|uniref:Uncharacterized protein n=1 Tax=Byssochlamys spectabilis (strain No. 5 / NBRC 109023) TaxID=1356009 RepID=V5FL32_BYSSN|nr:hypothetical protein FG03950.1 [Paecilomyces variotii No. 5]